MGILKRYLVLFASLIIFGTTAGSALAEVKVVRVAGQFGIGYLPLQMIRNKSLIEKHARKLGLGDIKVEWSQFGGGSAMNDALLSGNLDFASGGVGPLLTIWDKTKGNLNVKGVAAINAMPLYLNTSNPNVKTLKDFTDKDRIGLPAAKVSIQARTLQMAAEQVFGKGKHDVLDKWTVSMKHPDGVAALLAEKSEITAHLTAPPFQQQELENPKVRKVISSYDVLGGPSTFNTIWATTEFRKKNPKTYKAFVSALKEAMDLINADKNAATDVYIGETKSKLNREFVRKIIVDPENEFTMTPRNTMKYANFMFSVEALKNKPKSWKDYFFPEIHNLPGS